MTREEAIQEIQRELLVARRLREFCLWLRTFPEDEICEALLPIAVQQQRIGAGVAGAAKALFVVSPMCRWSCRDALRMLLDEWDISIEEVPWYLASVFPKEELQASLRQLQTESINKEQRTNVDTVRYWLDIYYELTPEKVKQRRELLLRDL